MYSADVAFSSVSSWTGHEVKNCSNQFLMFRAHGQMFPLHLERGTDGLCTYFSGGNIQFDIRNTLAMSYLYVDRIRTPRSRTEGDYSICWSPTTTAILLRDRNPWLDVEKMSRHLV